MIKIGLNNPPKNLMLFWTGKLWEVHWNYKQHGYKFPTSEAVGTGETIAEAITDLEKQLND